MRKTLLIDISIRQNEWIGLLLKKEEFIFEYK